MLSTEVGGQRSVGVGDGRLDAFQASAEFH
jgi:hypothetical protein